MTGGSARALVAAPALNIAPEAAIKATPNAHLCPMTIEETTLLWFEEEDKHRYTDFFVAEDRSSGHGSPSRRLGRLRRRRVPPFRSATIGLVGRQRRFLRAAYTLADAGQTLEAIAPLRSMFEFVVCQRWLALDPDRNWKLWMQEDHAARDRLRDRLRHHAPALHDAAVAALTPEQRDEADVIAAARKQVADELDE